MTQEARNSKAFFRLNGGLNTEINELNFPDGFTRDEENYELLVDGSRRRRKGLATESGAGAAHTVATFAAGDKSQAYIWTNAGGDPDKKILCFRSGSTIHFADADETVSDGWASGNISFLPFYSPAATTANVNKNSVSFSSGRGYLFVSGPYIKSFYVTYDQDTGAFSSTEISLRVRDFGDLDDGVAVAYEPATLTETHRYNLRNRGWREDRITQYDVDLSKFPSKNAIWHKGYERTYAGSIAEADGTRGWNSTKLENEAFGSSSAPRGSLFIDPYNSTFGYGSGASGTGAVIATTISTWTQVADGDDWTVTLTTADAHGLTPGDEFTIDGNQFIYQFTLPEGIGNSGPVTGSLDGNWTADPLPAPTGGATPNTITFTYESFHADLFNNYTGGFTSQYEALGSIDGSGTSLARASGAEHGDSFDAIEFHAGRIFYGGMKNQEFADTIVFSQVAQTQEQFGRCYQEADPTDENFNALVATDGGTIVIPGMGGVLNLVSVRNSLIVIARDGVWEISGGQRGVFTADGYSVRKLTTLGGSSADGYSKIEDTLVYSGPGGMMLIAPNQYTGQLEVQNAIEQTIQTLWNQVADAEQENCSMVYDDSIRRLYVLYGSDGASVDGVNTMLVFDVKSSAWAKYTFNRPSNNVLLCGFAIPNADDSSNNKKVKFVYQASTTTVQIADFDQTTFDDWDGNNGPLPYLVFGHDGIGDWQRRRQAPVITVFSKRTETGYTAAGGGFDPVNESSTLMSAYWDWTDDPITGKGGATYPDTTAKASGQQQVYRHTRQFVPSGVNDVDGYPVVVTRNKVRGRGRSLQLRFDGAEDKDSHILGFQTNYKVTRRV